MEPQPVPGGLLGERYRLQAPQGRGGDAALWCATDEVLGRPVAVRFIPGLTRAQVDDYTAAAARAGRIGDGRWVRVLDIGSVSIRRRRTLWIVGEWVDGPSLRSAVSTGPLPDPAAIRLIAACAQAVIAAEQGGAAHCRLHPDEVLLPASGQPRITGLELNALRHPDDPAVPDVQALGALLVAAVTGCWPLPGWAGLPRVGMTPQAWRARRPRNRPARALDELAADTLAGKVADAASFARRLSAVADLHQTPEPAPAPRVARWRPWAWRVVPPLLVAAIGFGAWSAGKDLGEVPGAARSAAPAFTPTPGTASAKQHLVWHRPPSVTSFDPNGDGSEDPGGTGLAVDGDPSTSWTTDDYRTAALGGLKPGVGLLLRLRHPAAVSTVRLVLSAAGADLQVRAGDTAPRQAIDLPVVASRSRAGTTDQLVLPHRTTARYWLLWFTSLPGHDGDYRLGVAEAELLG